MLQTRSDALRVWLVNTAGASASVVISNTPLPVIIQNSGGIFAMQSGAWNVSSTILNNITISNTQTAINIINSAGWVVNIANTANNTVILQNSGGLFSNQSGTWTVGISNSAGWIFNQANTVNAVNIINSAGWIVNVANTGGSVVVSNTQTSINIINSAGWVTSQANTFGLVVFIMDSGAQTSGTNVIASTVGVVTLMAANVNRVALSIYNASANPLFMKLGASASTASYTLMMVASGYYEMAQPMYDGIVTGIWQTANGNAYVTQTS